MIPNLRVVPHFVTSTTHY